MSAVTRAARVADVSAATPADRDRVIDAVRVASLLVVVVGHWLMAGLTVDDGQVRGVNMLTAVPVLQPLTWILQVMPLFFVAGGFANLTVWRRLERTGGGYVTYLRGRTIRLLRPVLVFALISQSVLGLAWIAGAPQDDVAYVARLLGRPLWFLAVYLVVTAAAPAMAAWHARAPVTALLIPAVGAVAMDLIRVTGDTDGPAYANFVFVWLAAQQLGFWYADGRLTGMSRRAVWAVATAVLSTLVVLTTAGPYPVSMIGLPGEMSNMAPPSVCLLLLAVGQTALVAVAGLTLVAGIALPAVGTSSWWLTRPLWLAVLSGVLVAFVVGVARLERSRIVRRAVDPPPAQVPMARLAPGMVLIFAGLFGFTTSGLEPFGFTGRWLLGMHTNVLPSSLCLVLGWALVTAVIKLPSASAHADPTGGDCAVSRRGTSRRPGTSRRRPC